MVSTDSEKAIRFFVELFVFGAPAGNCSGLTSLEKVPSLELITCSIHTSDQSVALKIGISVKPRVGIIAYKQEYIKIKSILGWLGTKPVLTASAKIEGIPLNGCSAAFKLPVHPDLDHANEE